MGDATKLVDFSERRRLVLGRFDALERKYADRR
jgi:hypothetical protein